MEQHQVHVWENTYIMEPKEEEKFQPKKIEKIVQAVMNEYLKDKEYSLDDAKVWSLELSNQVKLAIKDKANIPRYKIIVQTVIGEAAGQCVRVTSKFLWDPANDNWSSASVRTPSLFATCLVFGCYYE
eukprot:GEMP01053054.1.p1 GENE.GEMP01053054.1~~GEMP01053054.1.p1  ORF type:complete len:128 (+),score=24.47 GEMP01053054.1:68-451(+)